MAQYPASVDVGGVQVSNLALGLSLGLVLLVAGVVVVLRSPVTAAPPEPSDDRRSALEPPRPEANRTPRSRLTRRSLLALAALLPIPALVLLRNVGQSAAARRAQTIWAAGVRLVTDVSGRPIRPDDLQIGELVNVVPENLAELPETDRLEARAKAAVVLVRMEAREIIAAAGRENWHVDGIIAYSKICTHVGCPMGLYEQTTHHLLCPCHQSTFDLADNGTVVFGPATRPLPQLPLATDDDGYVVALRDFPEPVGPSYWERES